MNFNFDKENQYFEISLGNSRKNLTDENDQLSISAQKVFTFIKIFKDTGFVLPEDSDELHQVGF